MTLSTGVRLGPYEIVAPIGAGGMGEVWRAHDTRLERSVAIKVLPSDFAKNAQLRLRFEREAKAISQLTHPHICTLYDLGHEDGVDFLVMEYLEGETLADRLSKGPLPLDQVIRYGVQIAAALEKAHKAGVVHRDVKPGNIMLTKSGAKLLDFGLAKPSEGAVALTSMATQKKSLTEEGTIVGTLQYMAPEQIEGAEVDARADIFALGAVLYEMATGRRAFEGKTKASLIASILGSEPPPVSAVQPMTPAPFDRLVRTCLAKDPDERWQSAHDVALELRSVAELQPAAVKTTSSRLPWAIAALLLLALGGLAVWHLKSAAPIEEPVRSFVLPPDNTSFDFRGFAAPPALSPDGRRIVFGAAEPGKKRMLWIRSLDSFAAQQLAGTEEAMFPFWSPDGRFVAFFAGNALKKIEVGGGAPVVICTVMDDGRGGSWSSDGQTIIFAGRFTPIFRVSAAGGTPVETTALEAGIASHRWPEFLPDGRHFLYLASPVGSDDSQNTIRVGDIETKASKTLLSGSYDPHYWNGTLLFVRDQILTAQRFDPKTLQLSGEAVALKVPQIQTTPLLSKSIVTIAPSGTLLYQVGTTPRETQLTWYDRGGKAVGNLGEPGPYSMVNISRDAKSVAVSLVSMTTRQQSNIWSYDLARGVKGRTTFNDTMDLSPLWSPDGRKLAYISIGTGKFRYRLLVRDLASGSEEELVSGDIPGGLTVTSWSADGRVLLYTIAGKTTRSDIWWISLDERKPHPYLVTPSIESNPRFSPDGKWVVYQSTEGASPEVFLAPFPPTGAKWQVSNGGGTVPHWGAAGKELFYLTSTTPQTMMAVPIHLGATPEIGQATRLFSVHTPIPNSGMYDVTADGQRFLVNARIGEEPPPQPLNFVQHFDQELRAALGVKANR